MDVFQFNYYVDVAMIDTKELPGVLTFVFGAVSSRWIETNLAPSFIEAKIRKYVETFEAHTANELLQKLEKIGRSDCEGNYRLPEQPLTLSLAPFLGLIR